MGGVACMHVGLICNCKCLVMQYTCSMCFQHCVAVCDGEVGLLL